MIQLKIHKRRKKKKKERRRRKRKRKKENQRKRKNLGFNQLGVKIQLKFINARGRTF